MSASAMRTSRCEGSVRRYSVRMKASAARLTRRKKLLRTDSGRLPNMPHAAPGFST